MADLDKLYEMTVENNANIKHIIDEQKDHKTVTSDHGDRLVHLEGRGKKTVGEHLISFSKVCGAFIVIGGAFQLIIKYVG